MSLEALTTLEALRVTTQALKDIINAADNGEPYTLDQLIELYSETYAQGYAAIIAPAQLKLRNNQPHDITKEQRDDLDNQTA